MAAPRARAAALAAALAAAAASLAAAQVIQLQWIGTYESGVYAEDAAEFVTYDAATRRAYVSNGDSGRVDVISLVDPTNPQNVSSIDVIALTQAADPTFTGDSVRRVHAVDGVLVATVRADPRDANGKLTFVDSITGLLLASVNTGSHPGAISINGDKTAVACVNEGEFFYTPGDEDPVGGVTVVDVQITTQPVASVSVIADETYTFDGFDSEDLLARGVRLFGPNANNASANLEPEDCAFSDDGQTLYVMLQKNNAAAAFDMASRTFAYVDGLAYPTAVMDPSDEDGGINIAGSWDGVNVTFMQQPDSVAPFSLGGVDYLVTSNDGRSIDVANFAERVRLGELTTNCPTDALIRDDAKLGRLRVTNAYPAQFDASGNLECSTINAFGSRSFSVYRANPDGLELVYDSGSAFEETIAALNPDFFNSDSFRNNFDDRGDDKGPVPIAATVGRLAGGKIAAFIALERQSGVITYDVTDPTAPVFNDYLNRRNFGDVDISDQEDDNDFTFNSLDVRPESMVFVPAAASPICADMLVVANAATGSTSVYKVAEAPTERDGDGSCNTATDPASCDAYKTSPALSEVSECPADPPACGSADCGAYTSNGCGCDAAACAIVGDCCPQAEEVCAAGGAGTCAQDGSGDVNNDGATDVADLIVVQNAVVSGVIESPCIESAGDMNGDGSITTEDVIAIAQAITGSNSTSP